MGIFELVSFVIIAFFALCVFGISYLIFRQIKKNTDNRWVQSLSLLPMLIFISYVYRAFIPSDSFYISHFESVTGIDYPINGKVISRNFSNIDEFGDGTYISVHKVGKETIKKLPIALVKKKYEEITQDHNTKSEVVDFKVISEFKLQKTGENRFVSILNDSASVLIKIVQW